MKVEKGTINTVEYLLGRDQLQIEKKKWDLASREGLGGSQVLKTDPSTHHLKFPKSI